MQSRECCVPGDAAVVFPRRVGALLTFLRGFDRKIVPGMVSWYQEEGFVFKIVRKRI